MSDDTTQAEQPQGHHVLDKVVGFMEPLAASLVPPAWAGADDAQDVDKVTTLSRHTTEHVRGDKTYVDQTSETDETLQGQFDNRLKHLVDGEISDWSSEREARENLRANKRNFNRMLTLIGALVIGLFVTYTLQQSWFGPVGHQLAPYSFVITIVMDAGLALYGYIKKY